MTLRLEFTGEYDAVQRNFDRIGQGAVDTGGQSLSVRVGTSTLTFTASTNSATKTVTHGLGIEPVVIDITPLASPAFGKIPKPNVATKNATTFDVNGEINSAHTGDIQFMWVAYG